MKASQLGETRIGRAPAAGLSTLHGLDARNDVQSAADEVERKQSAQELVMETSLRLKKRLWHLQ